MTPSPAGLDKATFLMTNTLEVLLKGCKLDGAGSLALWSTLPTKSREFHSSRKTGDAAILLGTLLYIISNHRL